METRPTNRNRTPEDKPSQDQSRNSEAIKDLPLPGMVAGGNLGEDPPEHSKGVVQEEFMSEMQSNTDDRHSDDLALLLKGIRIVATPALWLGLLALCGGMVIAAFVWLATIPPLPDCKKITPLAPDSERLYCAERAARSGKVDAILGGFALVKDWSANHPLHNRVIRAQKEWSKALLAIAHEKAEKGNVEEAIELTRKIPASSPTYKEAQVTIAGWQKDQNLGATIQKAFQAALAKQDWSTAEDKILAFSRLGTSDSWRVEVKRLRQQLSKERHARQQLLQIQDLVATAPENPETLAQAIAQADKIESNSYADADANASRKRWIQSLLEIVSTRAASNLGGAIAAAQALPFDVAPPVSVRDIVWLSRAQKLANSTSPEKPLPDLLRQMWMTLFHIQQIGSNSPIYKPVQAVTPKLQAQLQDLSQLQVASSAANLGQIPSLQLAIQIAQSIAPDRSQRLYAQSLIARWKQDIQRAVDRPNLLEAQELASANTIPKLKEAIAQVTVIAPGRPLRPEAQAAIAQWTRKIQAIEDRPILDKAKTLASQKKLKEAVQQANKIQSGRALYGDAQAFAKKWTALIQTAEDQPILSRAKNLANSGDLSGAIEVASKIDSGRSLYNEAQSSISRWSAQIEASSRRFRRYPSRFYRDDYSPSFAPPSAPPSYASRPSRRALSANPFPELPPP